MISILFFLNKDNKLKGFGISGHADDGETGNSIICAAVSSVAYMTVNTVTEIIKANANVDVDESGSMILLLKDDQAIKACSDLLSGLQLHLQNLQSQYEKDLFIEYLEV